jgi:hypothetical protein
VTQEIINDMRKAALLSGKLSQWHLDNLRNFVLIALDNVKKAEIRYDLGDMRGKSGLDDKRSAGYVVYNITRKGRGKLAKNKEEMAKRCMALEQWVRNIMWSDTRVEIEANGKTLWPAEEEKK